MKTILTLIGGGDRDQVVFETAVAVARPLSAHLDFLHVHVGAGQAARYAHAEFARGAALRNALGDLQQKAESFSELAASHVRDLCASSQIKMYETPIQVPNVTASFREEKDDALER